MTGKGFFMCVKAIGQRLHVRRDCCASRGASLFVDKHGFTTTSMVLSLLITLSLVFTSAQVYRINSASAEVQDVADAAVLAAEGQVAEFMVIAQFCDATVLSMSLTGLAASGLGIAALCTPATAGLSEELLAAGRQVLEARDEFASRAKRALDKLQKALPYFSAACAAGVAAANDESSSGARYVGVAVLVPLEGEPIEADVGSKSSELLDDIDENAEQIRERARQAEEAAQEANEAKQRAFMHDCGNSPGYCLYERAGSLAGLSGVANPFYGSVDSWSFSVALERVKQYYAVRRYNDVPEDGSVAAQARSELRKRFYQYAYYLISSEGYVHESADSFDARFPRLPSNVEQMCQTSLYEERVYPLTEGEAGRFLHAWSGCPAASSGVVGFESVAYMDEEQLDPCPYCQFSLVNWGNVSAASSTIDNGFEYHYAAVADEADVYREACERASGPKAAVKEEAGSLFEKLIEAFKEAVDRRIEVAPPGRFGAVALVVNTGSTSAAANLAGRFVSVAGTLGPRAAVSAATLVGEQSDEGRTVLNSLLDGLREQGGVAVGATGIVLDLWSGLLGAYANGIDALASSIESGLNGLPLASASGLGSWAADKLRGALDAVGLQPAELKALKPVLVNSAHVVAKDEGSFGSGLLSVKQRIIAHPLYSTDLFSALLTDAEKAALDQVDGLGDSLEIASIELLGEGGPSIPLVIPLPAEVKQYGVGVIQSLFDRLRACHAETSEVRAWE